MIDAKIIGMSEMKKCRGTEVFWSVIVELVAEVQSNYSHCKLDAKMSLLDNAKWWKPQQSNCGWIIFTFILHPEAIT